MTGKASSLANSTAAVESFPEGFRWIEGCGISDDDGPVYIIPNHSDERARLNSQHYQIRFVLQNNQMAPVRKELRRGIKVLDAGCGTGIWSVEMAKDYPKSDFTATDINNVFDNTIVNLPTNVRFMLANTLDLPFEDDTFDYVFQRLQLGSFREKEWPQALQQLIRVTKPGGWIELSECKVWRFAAIQCLVSIMLRFTPLFPAPVAPLFLISSGLGWVVLQHWPFNNKSLSE